MTNTNSPTCRGCREPLTAASFQASGSQNLYCESCYSVRVFRGYSKAELHDAFELVEDKANWKNPIDTLVPMKLDGGMRHKINAAVIFFAGCEAKFIHAGRDRVRVTAPGYYASVGA